MTASLAPPPSPPPALDTSRDAWFDIAKETATESQRDDVWSLAAGVAFRIFLSLFPSLIAAVAILNLFVSTSEVNDLVANLGDVAPEAVVDLLDTIIDTNGDGSGGALAFGVIAGVWAATSAAVALMKALTRARGGADTRKLVMLRAIGLVLTVALFLAITVLLVLLVFGSQIQEALLPSMASGLFSAVVTLGRYVAAIITLQILFAFIYWIGPDRSQERPPWRWISPGSTLGVGGWLIASFGFSLYTRYVGSFESNPAYAGFGSVIVLMLWLQITMSLLLVGGELNYVRERRRRAAAEVSEGEGFGLVDPLGAIGEADLEPPEPVGPRIAVAPPAEEPVAATRMRTEVQIEPQVEPGVEPQTVEGAISPRPARRGGLRGLLAGAGTATTVVALWAVVRRRRLERE